MTAREIALQYAWKFVNVPYRWGGDDFSGIDCSGLVIEVLQAVGILPERYDATARDLFIWFSKNRVDFPHIGCLVFYGESAKKITHVEICVNSRFSIGATGGSRRVITEADAIRYNAFVKVRPIYKPDRNIVGFVDPFKEG